MSPRTMVKTLSYKFRLSFNIENIGDLFPGFASGEFAVLHGSSTILPLSMLLCVRAQLPYQLGGLETNVVFIDGGNTFRLYDISYIAQLHELDARRVLERIFISRAFTAHQITSLVLDRLQYVVEKYNSKLVVISDIPGLYLDKDVSKREARNIFSQLTVNLSKFSSANRVIVLAIYPPHCPSKRNLFFKAVVCGHADVVASVRPSKYGRQFVLEKHPYFSLGRTDFPSGNLLLTKFMGA